MAPRKGNAKLVDLVLDFTVYPRAQVDGTNVRRLVDALETGATVPPIVVCRDSGRVVDGFHRVSAARRVGLETIPAEFRSYADDADLFADAVRCNSAHGKPLTPYEHRLIVARWEGFGRTVGELEGILRVRTESMERRRSSAVIERVDADGERTIRRVPLKNTLRHLDGVTISQAQAAFNERAGGMSQRYYVRQVLGLIKSGSLDTDNAELLAELAELAELLAEALPYAGARR